MKTTANLLIRLLRLAAIALCVLIATYLISRSRSIQAALHRGIPPLDVLRALVPKHPIPMRTLFRECFLVNFAVDPAVMRRHLPPGIEPDIYDGKAWLSIVIAEMDRMRPAFLPPVFGVTYDQIVYRTVVRHNNERGVYFLRSDANSLPMSLAGDWLTFFRFHRSPIRFSKQANLVQCALTTPPAQHANIHSIYNLNSVGRSLPDTSPFPNLSEAQRFLVELFVAFGTTPLSPDVLKVRIKRGDWHIALVEDLIGTYQFMQNSPLFPPGSAYLDSIFYVKELPYYWYTLERP